MVVPIINCCEMLSFLSCIRLFSDSVTTYLPPPPLPPLPPPPLHPHPTPRAPPQRPSNLRSIYCLHTYLCLWLLQECHNSQTVSNAIDTAVFTGVLIPVYCPPSQERTPELPHTFSRTQLIFYTTCLRHSASCYRSSQNIQQRSCFYEVLSINTQML